MTELETMQRPGPERSIAESVVKILDFYATGTASESQGRIKSEVWIETLADLPAWAVEEARKRWFQGKIREARGFAPDPADIRSEAEGIAKVARGQWVLLQRILNAQPMITERVSEACVQEVLDTLKLATEKMSERERERAGKLRVAEQLYEKRRLREAREG